MKRARKSISLETKIIVIKRMEAGETRANICRTLGLAPSTVTTIFSNSEKIKKTAEKITNLRASNISYTRKSKIEKMEQLLNEWADDLTKRNITITQRNIAEKAKSIFDEIQRKEGGNETFTASKGWLARYKKRSKINYMMIGEVESDIGIENALTAQYKKIIEENDISPQLIFNVTETGLYWKKLPTKSLIAEEVNSTPGFKASKDRLTMLFVWNLSGTLKLKPLIVYHTETPRALKGIHKSSLPIIWASNSKACITQEVFSKWYCTHFTTRVLKFCCENKLPSKVLLLLHNVPDQPPKIEDIKSELDVKIIYCPPNTPTNLLPAMNQGLGPSFQANYLRALLKEIQLQMNISDYKLKEYWNDYNILKAINIIKIAWDEVSVSSKNWHDIWSKDNNDDNLDILIKEISQLAREIGLGNIEASDIIEILENNSKRLSNEELEDIAQQILEENQEKKDDENVKKIEVKDLEEILTTISKATEKICDIDPNWKRSSSAKRCIRKSLLPYYEILLHKKKKQQNSFEPKPGPSSDSKPLDMTNT